MVSESLGQQDVNADTFVKFLEALRARSSNLADFKDAGGEERRFGVGSHIYASAVYAKDDEGQVISDNEGSPVIAEIRVGVLQSGAINPTYFASANLETGEISGLCATNKQIFDGFIAQVLPPQVPQAAQVASPRQAL